MAKNISFLSSRSKGLTPDIKIIKNHISRLNGDIDFTFFTKSEIRPDKDEAKAIRLKKVDFCKGVKDIICVDISLPIRDMFSDSPHKRICVAVSYDIMFRYLKSTEKEEKSPFANFTHIIYTSPIMKEAVRNAHNTENIIELEGCSPLALDLLNKDSEVKIRKRLEKIFPKLSGKRLLSIVRSGNEYDKEALEHLDLGAFIDALDNDYMLAINTAELLKKAEALSNQQKEKIVLTEALCSSVDLLYVSDALITNDGYLAGAFAIKGLPIYSCDYCKNDFTEFMAEKQSLSFPHNATEIAKEINAGSFSTEICNALSYPKDKCATDILCEILNI